MLELIIVVVVVLVVVCIGIYIFKTMAKLFIGLGIAYLLFHIGFLWDYTEFDSKVPILDYFKPEYSSNFKNWYEDLTDERYKYAMLDIDKMEADIDLAIKTAISTAKDKYEQIDKTELLNSLYENLKEYNFDEVEASLIEFKSEMIDSGISEEEFNQILTELQNMSSSINDINNRLDEIEQKINN